MRVSSWLGAGALVAASLLGGDPGGARLAPAIQSGPSVVYCWDGSEQVPAVYELHALGDGSVESVLVSAELCRPWPSQCLDGSPFVRPSMLNGLVAGCGLRWSRDWDRRADCETGGRVDRDHNGSYESIVPGSANWAAHTGNPYFGGLQESMAFWVTFGGRAYAARPDLASPVEQKLVAERGLRVQGDGAWPWCSRHGF